MLHDWRSIIAQLGYVLVPRGCAGCAIPDEVLCVSCLRLFQSSRFRELPACSLGGAYACARYERLVRHAMLSWKDHGDQECDDVLARLLVDLACRIKLIDDYQGTQVVVVPTPSTARSIRHRGRWHMRALASAFVARLRDAGVQADMAALLTMSNVSGKSVETKHRSQRSDRISGGIQVRDRRRADGARVIILDDIVTTGTTMRRCVRALTESGAEVITHLSLAHVDPA